MTSTADSELEAALAQAMASRLRKAGLVGRYASARSELGDRVLALVRSGAGAYLWGLPGRGKTWAAAHVVREVVEGSAPHGRVPARLVTAKALPAMGRGGCHRGGARGAGGGRGPRARPRSPAPRRRARAPWATGGSRATTGRTRCRCTRRRRPACARTPSRRPR